MDERLDWFPCFPSKLLNALAGMNPDEGYVYWVVCLRIYETGRHCRDTVETLSRRSGIPKRRVEAALALSFAAGRLVKTEAGIGNPFADEVLADQAARHKSRKSAGKEGARRRWENPQSKQTERHGKATHLPKQSDAQLQSTDTVTPPNGGVARARKPKGRTPIPKDAVLSDVGLQYAVQHGFGIVAAGMMFDRFKDYHISRGSLMADWDAAWRTWVRNQIEFAKRDGERNGSTAQAARGGGRGSFATATARLRADIERRQGALDVGIDATDHGPAGRH